MTQLNTGRRKIKEFFYRYGFFVAVVSCALILSIVLIFVANYRGNNKLASFEKEIEPVNSSIIFTMPVADALVYKEYNGSALVYNATLKQWEAHKSIDFQVSSNCNVYAVYAGKVKDVYTNYLEGTVVVIDHENGISTSYGSLAENVNVKIGDVVEKGDVLGVASNTAMRECGIGNYLHFVTLDNDGKKIDPASYLNMSLK